MDELTRKRQELCNSLSREAEAQLRAVYRSHVPVTLEIQGLSNLEDRLWLLPADLSKIVQKVYAMIAEENELVSRPDDSSVVFRRNDLWAFLRTNLLKMEEELKKHGASLRSGTPSVSTETEERKAERSVLLRKLFDGLTILAIGRELLEPYCLQFNENGYDKNYKYYEESKAAVAVGNILPDKELPAYSQKYADRLRTYENFHGKYYSYNAKEKDLKAEGAWPSFGKVLDETFQKHGMATYAVLKAYLQVKKDHDIWSACDYKQLEYVAKDLGGKDWKNALIALEVGGVIDKRGSGRRRGERSIPIELIPLVEQFVGKWEATQQAGPTRRKYSQDGTNEPGSSTWDIFICHASEDKDEIARPLAQALRGRGLSVWYDEFTLTLGDSLSRSIDYGLANSRFGVVILSPSFFTKEWPRKELDGLTAKEASSGKTILPICHKATHEYIVKYSPILADKLAVSTDEGLDKIVDAILRALAKAGVTQAAPVSESKGTVAAKTLMLSSDKIIASAQEWAEQMLKNKATSNSVLPLTLSHWSSRINEGDSVDQVLGTVIDQYGETHRYDVRITKDGRIELNGSRAE